MRDADNLLNRLVHYVEDGFENGDQLPSERDLAQTFGVSRNQLRESLSRLEAYRFVAFRSKSRAIVTKDAAGLEQLALRVEVGAAVDPVEVREALEVRQVIEIAAVQLACERARKENLDRLQEILDAAERKIVSGVSIALEDELFHLEVIRSTQNAVLLQTVVPFYVMTRARRHLYFADMKRCRTSQAEHVKLYAALHARNARRAASLIEDHLRDAGRHWTNLLAKQSRSGRPARRRAT